MLAVLLVFLLSYPWYDLTILWAFPRGNQDCSGSHQITNPTHAIADEPHCAKSSQRLTWSEPPDAAQLLRQACRVQCRNFRASERPSYLTHPAGAWCPLHAALGPGACAFAMRL
jgi:hypothetical protein